YYSLRAVFVLLAGLAVLQGCERRGSSHDAHQHASHTEHQHEHELQQTRIPSDAARTAGIEISLAGPGRIDRTLTIYGQLTLNENKVVHVMPRFPGLAKEIKKQL